jgi:hypothetical protein
LGSDYLRLPAVARVAQPVVARRSRRMTLGSKRQLAR